MKMKWYELEEEKEYRVAVDDMAFTAADNEILVRVFDKGDVVTLKLYSLTGDKCIFVHDNTEYKTRVFNFCTAFAPCETTDSKEMVQPTFTDVTKEMLELYEKKNADYGNSFDPLTF